MTEQVTHVTLPMELVGKIVQIINNLPYGQVAAIANELGQCIQEANTIAGKDPKEPVLQ